MIEIRGRNYRDADELDAFDEEQRAKPVKRKPFPRSDAFGGEVARLTGTGSKPSTRWLEPCWCWPRLLRARSVKPAVALAGTKLRSRF